MKILSTSIDAYAFAATVNTLLDSDTSSANTILETESSQNTAAFFAEDV